MWGMCNRQFIDEWDNRIKPALVEHMVETLNTWFYQEYDWDNSEDATTEEFATYSNRLRAVTQNITADVTIDTLLNSYYQDHQCQNADIITGLRDRIIEILVNWGKTVKPKTREPDIIDNNNYYNGYWETRIIPDARGIERSSGIRELIDPGIKIIVKYIQDKRNNGDGNITQILDIARNGNDYRIASWSKLLAALEPGRFFIYDSRVAIALTNFCYPRCRRFWKIPYKRFTANNRINYNNFIERVGYNAQQHEDFPTCYYCYHDLLRTLADRQEICQDNQGAYDNLNENITATYTNAGFTRKPAIMAHIEKMLFMLAPRILREENN